MFIIISASTSSYDNSFDCQIISSNLNKAAIESAYLKGAAVTKIFVHDDLDMHSGYLRVGTAKALLNAGYKPVENGGFNHYEDSEDDERVEDRLSPEDAIGTYLFVAKLGNPDFRYKKIEADVIELDYNY